MRTDDIKALTLLLKRMNGPLDRDFPPVVTEEDKKAVRLAIKVLKEEDTLKRQYERNNKDALEMADWCLRNAATLQRFGERIERNVPQCKTKVEKRKRLRERTDGNN